MMDNPVRRQRKRLLQSREKFFYRKKNLSKGIDCNNCWLELGSVLIDTTSIIKMKNEI